MSHVRLCSTMTSVDVSRRSARAGSGGGAGAGAAAMGVEEMYLDGALAGAGSSGPLAALTAAVSRIPFKPKLLDVLKEGGSGSRRWTGGGRGKGGMRGASGSARVESGSAGRWLPR